jgi:hypothetical protein
MWKKAWVVFTALVALGAGVTAIWQFILINRPHKEETVGERLQQLKLNSSRESVEAVLGIPVAKYRGDDATTYRYEPVGPTHGISVRIYRLGQVFVQVGYDASDSVKEWVVQSCDQKVKIELPRANGRGVIVLNGDTFHEVSQAKPLKALYRYPADSAPERLEFLSGDATDFGVGEVWGVGPGCDSHWVGRGEEPAFEWNGDGHRPTDLMANTLPFSVLEGYRSGKLVNLYGQADGVWAGNTTFPLLPGHGTPMEVIASYTR